jgi:DNA polymerase-3 subunit delta|tara:strand:- start:7216 stop:8220 length:1005 start_codon:yes stop_codon:yes gene_type:complete
MPSEKANQIVKDIKKGDIKSVYFLMGEEAYYIDAISNFIESTILSEEEKGFNQMVLYGRDVSIDDIVSHAKRYPMMAERQVIIVKEAQDLSRTIEGLVAYVENPQPTTVLVFCYKYKTLDKRKKLSKTIAKNAVLFESKKLYENQVPDWIRRVLSGRGHTITPKAAQMLVEFLGNDLAKINNELQKLQLIMQPGEQITPQLIEENIGISKDFNNFELQKAIGEKNVKRAFAIMQYFHQNPKKNPLVMTVALLYGFFAKLLKYHSLSNKGDAAKVLKVSPYFVKDYQVAARNYPMKKVSAIISSIRDIDMKSKGVGASNLSQADLLKELLIKIFN